MSTYNIGFYEEISKLSLKYCHISSNTHLFSSSDYLIASDLIIYDSQNISVKVSIKSLNVP